MKSQAGIYEIRNVENNKVYIGSSKNIKNRWNQHISMLNNNKHHSIYLQNAWNKYGKDSFEFSILEITENIDTLFDLEQEWMDATKCYSDAYGYNMSSSSRYVDSSNINSKTFADALKEKDRENTTITKPEIILYCIEDNEDYLLSLQNKSYSFVDKFKFLSDLYEYYDRYMPRKDYLCNCNLCYNGMYFSMNELYMMDFKLIKNIVNNCGIDLINFIHHQLDKSCDIYMSRIIKYEYKIEQQFHTLIIYTEDKSYEICLNTEL